MINININKNKIFFNLLIKKHILNIYLTQKYKL
jgi:hypothetical protein